MPMPPMPMPPVGAASPWPTMRGAEAAEGPGVLRSSCSLGWGGDGVVCGWVQVSEGEGEGEGEGEEETDIPG
jgi:hypothetical protein